MNDADKILQMLEGVNKKLDQQGKTIGRLETGQKNIQTQLDTVELKVENFHSEQKQANVEIITTLHDMGEINTKETNKRLDALEDATGISHPNKH